MAKRKKRKTKKRKNKGKSFWESKLATVLKVVLFIVILFLINLLISRNNYSTFYLLVGIELLLGFVFIIIRLIFQQKNL